MLTGNPEPRPSSDAAAPATGASRPGDRPRPRSRPAPGVGRDRARSRRAPGPARIRWQRSSSIGLPNAGRLVAGVQLPREGSRFFTWDPDKRRFPNRGWRRFGSDRLVRLLLRVISGYAAAHPAAPRLGVGDLSRPHGGNFGARYGRPAHVSHQNGLDVDIYYPRRDRTERAPATVAQIDRALAQDLVDRFVRAGARFVFVGPQTGLAGPSRIVQPLAGHNDHLHVRIPPGERGEPARTASGR